MTLLLFLIFVVLLIGPARTWWLMKLAAGLCIGGFALLLTIGAVINS